MAAANRRAAGLPARWVTFHGQWVTILMMPDHIFTVWHRNLLLYIVDIIGSRHSPTLHGGWASMHGGQRPVSLEYQIYPPAIDTLVTGMVRGRGGGEQPLVLG